MRGLKRVIKLKANKKRQGKIPCRFLNGDVFHNSPHRLYEDAYDNGGDDDLNYITRYGGQGCYEGAEHNSLADVVGEDFYDGDENNGNRIIPKAEFIEIKRRQNIAHNESGDYRHGRP